MSIKMKKFVGLLLITAGAFSVLWSVLNRDEQVVVDEVYSSAAEDEHIHEEHAHDHQTVKHKKNLLSSLKSEEKNENESSEYEKFDVSEDTFKNQSKKILDLAENYKQNKKRLIEIVSSEDPFKKDKKATPHTVSEIKQHQEGALRVLALRVLMQNESKENLKKDLAHIIEKAKDPTMSKIAKAVLNSVEEGRPFFEDMSDAITNL